MNEDLSGRQARCHGELVKPSSRDLPFFEFMGEGSRDATLSCKHCGYYKEAHEYSERRIHKEPIKETRDHTFEPHGPYEFDRFYCGHSGWD